MSTPNGNRRRNLWKADPHCHWCGIETVSLTHEETKGKLPPLNMATLDHLHSRLDPARLEAVKPGECRTVLACWKCNHERGREEQKRLGLQKRDMKQLDKLIERVRRLEEENEALLVKSEMLEKLALRFAGYINSRYNFAVNTCDAVE